MRMMNYPDTGQPEALRDCNRARLVELDGRADQVSQARGLSGRLRDLAARVVTWGERRAVARRLAEMSDRSLADIGLRRVDIHRVFDTEFARARAAAGRIACEWDEHALAKLGLGLPRPAPAPAITPPADAQRQHSPGARAALSTQETHRMKTTLLAAAAALSLVAATAAHAESEGNGDPFRFRMAGATTDVRPGAYAADTGSAAYPNLAGRPSQLVAAGGPDGVPATGSEGAVQTANSLPRSFAEGTVAYAQQQSVNRYFAAQEQHRRVARAATAPRG